MNTREAARGRMPKEYFRGYQMSDWVELDLSDTAAYGKIIDFDKGPDEAIAVVSIKAILDPRGEWVRYVGRDDFVEVPVSELSRATESYKVRMRDVASVTQEENQMSPLDKIQLYRRAPRVAPRAAPRAARADELSWHVAPEDQGQTVEYAYAMDADGTINLRITDQHDNSVQYFVYDERYEPEGDPAEWWQPWNHAPDLDPAGWDEVPSGRRISTTRKETPMRTRRTSRAPRSAGRRSAGRRSAGRFGLHGQPGLRRHPAALNPAAQKMRELQEQLEAGKIDNDEFESQMEQLEAQQRHSWVARKAAARRAARRTAKAVPAGYVLTDRGDWLVQLPDDSSFGFSLYDDDQTWEGGIGVAESWKLVPEVDVPQEVKEDLGWILTEAQQRHSWVARRAARTRNARIEPADVMLLQNAVKQLGKSKDADEAVRMLRDIIDAASDMKKELEPKHTARTAGADDLALLESAIGTLRKTKDEGEKVALLRDIAGAAAEWMKELGS